MTTLAEGERLIATVRRQITAGALPPLPPAPVRFSIWMETREPRDRSATSLRKEELGFVGHLPQELPKLF